MNSISIAKCKFMEWYPLEIEVLSFSPDGRWLAICHSNAEILIFDPTSWHLLLTIPGDSEGSIRNISWVNCNYDTSGLHFPFGKYDLITTGLDGKVTLWNLHSMKKRSILDSYGGAIFDSKFSPNGKDLAIACDDGAIRLYTLNNEELIFTKSLTKLKGRALSLCWFSDNIIFVGSAHSTIMRYSVKSRNSDYKMKVDIQAAKNNKKNQDIQIWCLLSLSKSNQIVSGDSSGRITFWNADTCIQLITFKEHQSDILALSASVDENYILASGVDPKIVVFSQLTKNKDWTISGFKYAHSHDIRSICISSKNSVVSGGLDSSLCFFQNISVISDLKFKPLRISLIPPVSSQWISISTQQQLVLCQHRNLLELWSLVGTIKETNVDPIKAAVIKLNDSAQITCSDLSTDGQLIAASNYNGTRIFGINLNKLEIGVIDCPFLKKHSAYSLKFINKDIIAICFEDISSFYESEFQKSKFKLILYDIWNLKEVAEFDDIPNPITRIDISQDSQWLSTIDTEGIANVYNIDLICHSARLPTIVDGLCTSISFRPGYNQLASFTSKNQFYIYDLDRNSIKKFNSNENPIHKIPDHLLRFSDGPISDSIWIDFASSSANSQSYLLCKTTSALCTINLTETYSDNPLTISEDQLSTNLSRRWYDIINDENLQLLPQKRLIPQSLHSINLLSSKRFAASLSSPSSIKTNGTFKKIEGHSQSDFNNHSIISSNEKLSVKSHNDSTIDLTSENGISLLTKNNLNRRKFIVNRLYKYILGFKLIHNIYTPSTNLSLTNNTFNSSQDATNSPSLFLFSISLKRSQFRIPAFNGKRYGS